MFSIISSTTITAIILVAAAVAEVSDRERADVSKQVKIGRHTLVKRRAGDQPNVGHCNFFRRGGTSRFHFYACCNNCGNSTSTPTCDGETYQSASSNPYCDKCGVDTKGGDGVIRDSFKCGGCSGQEEAKKSCQKRWILGKVQKIPGFCWVFANCFKAECKKTGTPATCFNMVCEEGETTENCPSDCCYKENKACIWNATNVLAQKPNSCPRQCCGETSCCLVGGAIQTYASKTMTLILFALALMMNQNPMM